MKITIEIKNDNSSLKIEENKKIKKCSEMTREKQIMMLNALSANHNLFLKFLKDE